MASKPAPTRTASFSLDEIKYKKKLKELRRKVRDIEEENDKLLVSLMRARRQAQRIRMERAFLQTKIQTWGEGGPSDRELESSSGSEDEEDISLAARIGGQEPPAAHAPVAATPPTTAYTVPSNVPPINVGRAASASFPLTSKTGGGKKHRRITNAFSLFSKRQRSSVEKEVSERDGDEAEVSKVLDHRWKSLSSEEKQRYIDEAEALEKSEKKEPQGAPATFRSASAKLAASPTSDKEKTEDGGDEETSVKQEEDEPSEMRQDTPQTESSSPKIEEVEGDEEDEAKSGASSPMEID